MASSETCSNCYLNEVELRQLLKNVPIGFKNPQDPFFENANKLLVPFVKQGVISLDDEEDFHRRKDLIIFLSFIVAFPVLCSFSFPCYRAVKFWEREYVLCNVPGCRKEFNTVYEYESHYNTLHRYLCNQCKKCLPTPHFLDLHILEQHDSYFSILAERKPMYSCFLEECKLMSASPHERKDHCIRVHKFPANFRFETSPSTSAHPLQHQNERKNSEESDELMSEGNKTDTATKVFKTFSFGHHKQKVFDSKSYAKILSRNNKKENRMEVENVSALESSKTVEDLMDSLPAS